MVKFIEDYKSDNVLLKLAKLHTPSSVQFEFVGKSGKKHIVEIGTDSYCQRIDFTKDGNTLGILNVSNGEITGNGLIAANWIVIIYEAICQNAYNARTNYEQAIKQVYANRVERAQREFDMVTYQIEDMEK